MDLTKITSADFKRIANLLEKKGALLDRLNAIDRELSSFGGGNAPAEATPFTQTRPGRKPKRARRGKTKEAIVAALKSAGKRGITVKDLAGKIGGNYKAVYVWFQTTGKRIKEVKKVAPATFAWVE